MVVVVGYATGGDGGVGCVDGVVDVCGGVRGRRPWARCKMIILLPYS